MKIPTNVAIIMDGNRRWARKHGLRILAGHERVAFGAIEPLIVRCIELGIPYLTLWVFSTENWKRDKREVGGIMGIFRKSLKKDVERFHKMGVRLRVLGDLSRFSKDIREGFLNWIEKSKNNKKITLTLAINYGGREEILRAVARIAKSEKRKAKRLTEEEFAQYLDIVGMPDPDLMIRTGGEKRLSGFMLWQSEYSELYFTKTLMPDFGPKELEKAIKEYSQRQRRFGK